jgi:exopolysaccharide/PEP-CTERM locus tyrosine autokinase
MSIVERALSKLQASQERARATARQQRPVPTRDAPERGAAKPVPPPVDAGVVAPRRTTPQKHYTIDLARLREERMIPPEESVHRALNEFRRIKWPLLAAAAGKPDEVVPRGHLIQIASSVAGEGKTFICFNLALSIALEKDCSVLIVDADLARPRLTRVLGMEKEPGLTDLLTNEQLTVAETIVTTDVDKLTVLPAGTPSPNAPELLASNRMEAIAEQLLEITPRALVLFDSSPLLLTNEAQVLSGVVGQVVLVVRAGHTTQTLVNEALTHLEDGPKVSCVLNQASYGNASDYYYGSYPDASRQQPDGRASGA